MGGRGKKALLNTSTALIQELVAVVCGFILPRLILKTYGSTYNGITTSITQFLSCAVLLRAGIGGATRAALYKPLANKDTDTINSIMSATDRFMKKIAAILAISIVVFSCVYPFFVKEEFSWFFSFTLFLIIGISTFAESLFGITYIILIQADQALYIVSIIRTFVYILNTVVSCVLILNGFSIHVVKLGGALAFCVFPVFLNVYAKKKYKINLKVAPNENLISQRWDAFWHQVATFVMNNTDTVVLTAFSNMLSVSVYSVYNLVISGLKKLVFTFTNGLEGAFGSMIASDSKDVLDSNFRLVDYIMFVIATIVNCCAGLLIVPFVSIYTKDVTDAPYHQPIFAAIIIIAHYFNCIRQPYQLVVQAAGHYAQTKKGAIIEPILNIIISILAVIKWGLVGVAVGTLVASMFRTIQFAVYVSNNLVNCAFKLLVKGIVNSTVICLLVIILSRSISIHPIHSYYQWGKMGVCYFLISAVFVFIFSLLFYRNEFFMLINKCRSIVFKRK